MTSNTCTCLRSVASITTRNATSTLRRREGLPGTSIRPSKRPPAASSGSIAVSFPTPARRPPRGRPGRCRVKADVRGVVRLPPGKTLFTPQNDAAGNLWYWADIPALTASAFPQRLRRLGPAVRYRSGCPTVAAGRPAQGRSDAHRPVQPPPGIRGHLVRHRPDARRRLFGLRRQPLAGLASRIVKRNRCFSRRHVQPPCSLNTWGLEHCEP